MAHLRVRPNAKNRSSRRGGDDNISAAYPEQLFGDLGDVDISGMAASSSMWGIGAPLLAAADDERGEKLELI